jgi:hypothetical protein
VRALGVQKPPKNLTLVLGAAVLLVAVASASATAAAMITGASIQDGTVTGIDLKNGTVAGADLKDGSVGGVDVKDGSLTTSDIAAASQDALRGQAGAPGISGYVLIASGETTVPSGGTGTARAICTSGLRAISGGGYIAGGDPGASKLTSNEPDAVNASQQPIAVTTESLNAWSVAGANSGATSSYLRAYVICGNVS